MVHQVLTLTLDGITASDYLAWVRDPEPLALGQDLCEVRVEANPLGDTVEAILAWRGAVPAPSVAAQVAGLPLTPEVIRVRTRELAVARRGGDASFQREAERQPAGMLL